MLEVQFAGVRSRHREEDRDVGCHPVLDVYGIDWRVEALLGLSAEERWSSLHLHPDDEVLGSVSVDHFDVAVYAVVLTGLALEDEAVLCAESKDGDYSGIAGAHRA